MTPPAQRKIIVKNDFAKIFGAYKTQQFVDPPQRGSSGTIHRTIAWNLTGNLIATGATDKTIRIWHPERVASSTTSTNTRNPPPQAELKGHTAEVTKVLFNPVREHELVSTSADATVRFWDTRTKGAATSKLDIGGGGISLAWSVDGTALIAGNRYEVLADISTANPGAPVIIEKHRQTRETNQTTFSNAFPPQDLLITNGDGSVKIVDYPSFDTMHTLSSHTSSCSSIALSPTGKYVAVGGSDAMIAIWDTYDWVCKRTFSNANSGKVSGLTWSWDGRYITSSCEDVGSTGGGEGKSEGFEIYHAETGNVVFTVPTKTSPVPAVEWHPSKYALAYTVVENGKSSLKICGLESNP